MGLLMNSIKHLKNKNTNQSQTLQKIEEGRILPNSFYDTSITLKPNLDKDITKKETTGQNLS